MYPVTDLCDAFSDKLQIVEPLFTDFGGRLDFGGPISTVKCFEDNSVVRLALEEPGEGRVLVVDGGGSDRCALLGDNLVQLAIDNGWAGIVVYGCIRDAADISQMDMAVKALNTHPKKSDKKNQGERDVLVRFGGVNFMPDDWLYADLDGIVVSEAELEL
ncbi:ribonuclease E activity regulator RraA [Salinisphaera sp. Q1T1-3]|uniref:ribonuclease E activity regulator RraA n=1 Tax=Salinisphaera sp. Q1T1-3 TaxID=2321229 RepID=UPI000E738053|nr:ribonuclease E activity regulator RraA [Salinisphaera sp. Q1T1-3]RJS95292.1 RraA family protein [Salinisphaera sp. Q1T1-3]